MSIDLLLVALATVIAVMLRGTFDTISRITNNFDALFFHFPRLCSHCFSCGRAGSNALAIQYCSGPLSDYRFDCAGYPAGPCLYLLANRLEGVARSLPVTQGALIVIFLFPPVVLRDFGMQGSYMVRGMIALTKTRTRQSL